MADEPVLPPAGLSETTFGLRYYVPEIRTIFDVIDIRRKSGELWGEVTVRCNFEGAKGQLDGNRLRQGNFNFSSLTVRKTWANSLSTMVPKKFEELGGWENFLERFAQEVLEHQQVGAVHGAELSGQRATHEGRPWAAWPILPENEIATLFARGGAGKTTLTGAIAFSMARGESLIPGIRVDRPYRTAILDWETNAETANDLFGLVAETHHVSVPPGVWYEQMDAPIERSLQKIATVMDKHRADCVIIDSVTMAMLSSAEGGGDSAEPITRMYQGLRKLGVWGLLIDHITGGDLRGRRPSLKAYGSIFKMNHARHGVVLHTGQRVGDTTQVYLLCSKSNVGPDRWAMPGTFIRSNNESRWAFGDRDFELYDRLMHEPEEDEAESKLSTPRQAEVFQVLLLSAFPRGLTVSELQRRSDASSPAYVRKVLHALANEGLVESIEQEGTREKVWVITQAGIDLRNRPPDSPVQDLTGPGLPWDDQ